MPPTPYYHAPQLSWIKDQVLCANYLISEHVVRCITAGAVTLSEIETALNFGRFLEARKGLHNRGSCLVMGHTKDKTLSILCTKANRTRLVILLVHMKAPAWKWNEGYRLSKGVTMPENTSKCFFCNGDVIPIVVGNFDYRLEGNLYVIKKVPAGLCLGCGEKYITSPVAKKINSLVASGNFEGMETVRVIAYD